MFIELNVHSPFKKKEVFNTDYIKEIYPETDGTAILLFSDGDCVLVDEMYDDIAALIAENIPSKKVSKLNS
jgi:hypothetical protein